MGDLDKNCKVDLVDVLIFVEQWLDPNGCPGHPEDCADLDEQGGVTATDFAIIAASWLEDGFLIINEVMSDNETTIQDEYGEYDDWIEIYNPTGLTIGMSGLFLADDDGNVWEIPAGVAISPGEYKLFWADNDWPAQGNTHTNFGLSNDGDGVTLYDADGVTVIDTVTFGPLADDVSHGRWPEPRQVREASRLCTRSTVSRGLAATGTPAASRAATLSATVPPPSLTRAPACPIRTPGTACRPETILSTTRMTVYRL